MDLELIYFQSNIEGELIDKIWFFLGTISYSNAGAYTHLHRDR
jgi:3-dehydroquinate dehydratase